MPFCCFSVLYKRVRNPSFCLYFRVKESTGWQQVFTSPRLDWLIDRVALNAKVMGGSLGDNDKMVAVASGTEIILWSICPDGNGNEIGKVSVYPKTGSAQRIITSTFTALV